MIISFSLGIVGTNDMEDLAVIKALMENGYIYDILVDAYASNILHSSNEYLASSTHMTVFRTSRQYVRFSIGIDQLCLSCEW